MFGPILEYTTKDISVHVRVQKVSMIGYKFSKSSLYHFITTPQHLC